MSCRRGHERRSARVPRRPHIRAASLGMTTGGSFSLLLRLTRKQPHRSLERANDYMRAGRAECERDFLSTPLSPRRGPLLSESVLDRAGDARGLDVHWLLPVEAKLDRTGMRI